MAIVRIGLVLGKEGGALKQMLTPFRLGVGGRLGSGQQWMPWIHVDDLIDLFVFALDSGASGPLNGAAPKPVRNAEFTAELARTLHRPAIFPAPRFALNHVVRRNVGDPFRQPAHVAEKQPRLRDFSSSSWT